MNVPEEVYKSSHSFCNFVKKIISSGRPYRQRDVNGHYIFGYIFDGVKVRGFREQISLDTGKLYEDGDPEESSLFISNKEEEDLYCRLINAECDWRNSNRLILPDLR